MVLNAQTPSCRLTHETTTHRAAHGLGDGHEPEQAIEERHARSDAAHRPTHTIDLRSVADPAEIREYGRPHTRVVRSDLEATQPERVAALRGIGTLPAHRLRSAKEPSPLRGK